MIHRIKRRILGTLHSTHNRSRVLLREKALWHLNDQHRIECNGKDKDDERDGRIGQYPDQAAPV
jgi:hypothetical protein